MDRRTFLHCTTAALGAPALRTLLAAASSGLHVATNTYPWGTFANRTGRTFPLHTDESLAAIASTGITGYEPAVSTAAELEGLDARLKAHGLEMRSLYVNSTLHDEAQAGASVASVLAIARQAAGLGTRIVVTNPSPIKWGGPENKTDAQLRLQARSLDKLGLELKKLGLRLAYHNHDIELRLGGREFHHMLTATDPENVGFCLDAHWVFRGCGNSEVALFDVLELHGGRIIELHLRQSQKGVWSEVFEGKGDLDYHRLAGWLNGRSMKPHLTLEQAVEPGSPGTLDAVSAHRRSLEEAQKVFAGMAA